MGNSIYSFNNQNNNSFDISSINVEDFILTYNTSTFIELNVIFNCDIEQIINKYSVIISLVDDSDNSIVYAQFTPSITDFTYSKNTIPVNGGLLEYSYPIGYFSSKYVDKNRFYINNQILTTNSPTEGSTMRLIVTVDGIDILFGTKNFNTFSNSYMSIIPTTFNYLQNYDLALKNYYFENTDIVSIKINNIETVTMNVNTINNFSTSFLTPYRVNTSNDFTQVATAKSSFSGTNSYVLTSTYTIITANTLSTVYIDKGGDEKKISTNINDKNITTMLVGCSKLFSKTLNRTLSVTDTIFLEFPIFKNISSGLTISSITPSNSNVMIDTSYTLITDLGLGKFKLDLRYLPTNDSNLSATYATTIILTLTHPTMGTVVLRGVSFGNIYSNS